MISSNLKWGDHVKYVTSRASRLLGFIKRLVRCNDSNVLVKLFCTLCRPILEYGIPGWFPYQIGHLQSIEKIQKRLARTCIPAPRGELEYKYRLEMLDLTSMHNRYNQLAISFVAKCLYGKYDIDPFQFISINSRHLDSLKFTHNYARTDSFKYTVFNRFPVFFDQLPPDLRDQLLFNISGFLVNCKGHFKNHSWNWFLFLTCAFNYSVIYSTIHVFTTSAIYLDPNVMGGGHPTPLQMHFPSFCVVLFPGKLYRFSHFESVLWYYLAIPARGSSCVCVLLFSAYWSTGWMPPPSMSGYFLLYVIYKCTFIYVQYFISCDYCYVFYLANKMKWKWNSMY